jgi:hypothetical protein
MSRWRSSLLLAMLLVPLASGLRVSAAAEACRMSCCQRSMPAAACPTGGALRRAGCPPAQRLAALPASLPLVVPDATVVPQPDALGAPWRATGATPLSASLHPPDQPPRA